MMIITALNALPQELFETLLFNHAKIDVSINGQYSVKKPRHYCKISDKFYGDWDTYLIVTEIFNLMQVRTGQMTCLKSKSKY